jgi:quercetin dioxygenase-like cupin family protein
MEIRCTALGDGHALWVAGDRYIIRARGDDTGGAYALIEALVPPGGGPPPHVHTREDEAFYVLEGDLEFHADGRSFRAGPGAWVTLPRGSLHRFYNASDRPARLLILVTPAGFERFFEEVGVEADDPVPFGPAEAEGLVAAAARYGVEIRVGPPAAP